MAANATMLLIPATARLHDAVSSYRTRVRTFEAAVHNIGVQMIPLRWNTAIKALDEASRLLEAHPRRAAAASRPARAGFDELDALESAARNVEVAGAIVTDPNVLADAKQSMSAAFSAKIDAEVKLLHDSAPVLSIGDAGICDAKNADAKGDSIRAPVADEESEAVAKSLAAAFGAAPRGGMSTDLYIEQLKAVSASGLLGAAKTSIFGADAAADAAVTAEARGPANVRYTFEPLIAAAAGSTSVSGLNYKLVQRLRTMFTTPEPVQCKLTVPGRLIAYNECAATIICAEPQSDSKVVLKDYEAVRDQLEPKLICPPEPLILHMRASFTSAWSLQYGKTGPTSVREFTDFLIPGALEKSYIVQAISATMIGAVNRAIIRPIHATAVPKAPFEDVKAEVLVTHTIQVLAMSKLFARRLQDMLSGMKYPVSEARTVGARAIEQAVASLTTSKNIAFGMTPTLKLATAGTPN
jgi:hypothetical protein